MLEEFFDAEKLQLKNCVAVTTDATVAMVGRFNKLTCHQLAVQLFKVRKVQNNMPTGEAMNYKNFKLTHLFKYSNGDIENVINSLILLLITCLKY